MPRPLRPIDDRLVYHVIHRGNNSAPVFFVDPDFEPFLEAIGDLKKRRPFAFHGYCPMSNHLFLLIQTSDIPISRIMQSLLVSHTLRFHRRHQSSGHDWQGRFKSPMVQDRMLSTG
jgi:putative transposase